MAQNGQGGPQLDEPAGNKFILLFGSPGSERMQRCLTLGLLLATLLSLGKLLVLSDSHFADVARRKDETKQKEALPAANPEPRNAVHTRGCSCMPICTPLLMHAYAILATMTITVSNNT